MKVAGSETSLFTEDAISQLWKYSKGLPRLINTICDNALLEGFLVKSQAIDGNTIKTVAVDLGLNGESS